MSLIPTMHYNWWDDFDRPNRLFDQNFGLSLRRDDLLNSPWPSQLYRGGYIRPWRNQLLRQTSGSSTVQADKDKFQVFRSSQLVYLLKTKERFSNNILIRLVLKIIIITFSIFAQVILDVQQFAPSEIVVKTVNNNVIVEGKHEEKQDEHGYISRHFVRKYLLPSDADALDVQSSLSSDGVLTITAPKKVRWRRYNSVSSLKPCLKIKYLD